jgi:hypothetical protein
MSNNDKVAPTVPSIARNNVSSRAEQTDLLGAVPAESGSSFEKLIAVSFAAAFLELQHPATK